MASAIKKVNKISQIVRLKQVMQRWKHSSFTNRPVPSSSSSDSDRFDSASGSTGAGVRLAPSGFLAVYVGPERRRFVIPTRFLNLPIFVSLFNQAAEEFGFQSNGGIILPCEVEFFKSVMEFLERDERRYGVLGVDEFLRLFSESGFDFWKDASSVSCSHGITPLLQKTRA